MSENKLPRVTRRRFLKDTSLTLAAAGAAPVLSAPFVSSAMAAGKSLSIVQWSHFVPAYDTWFDLREVKRIASVELDVLDLLLGDELAYRT